MVHSIDWGGATNSNLLALGTTSGTVKVMDSEKRTPLVGWDRGYRGMGGMHWNGNVLAVGRADGNVSLFDIRKRVEVTKIAVHKRRVHGVKWSTDGRHLATGDESGVVHVWDHRARVISTVDKNIRMKHKGLVKVCCMVGLVFPQSINMVHSRLYRGVRGSTTY